MESAPKELTALLGPTATVAERVEGLLRMGLPGAVIAEVVDVTPRTLRRWLREEPRTYGVRRRQQERLDDLRVAAYILVKDGRIGHDYAAHWLIAQRMPDGDRPVDLLRTGRPRDAFALACAAVVVASAERSDESPSLPHNPLSVLSTPTIVDPSGVPLAGGDRALHTVEARLASLSGKLQRQLASSPELVKGLHWHDFELLIAELFERDGFEVVRTPAQGDKGVDFFAARHTGLGTLLYVVECKHYTRPVGPDFVRQLAWVVDRHRATGGVLATTSRFTAGARAEQREVPYRLSLADYADIRRWLLGGAIF